MKRMVKACCAAAAVLVAIQFHACGGSQALPAAGQCSVSLSGGATGRYDCVSVIFFDARESQLILSILPTGSGPFNAALTLGAQNSLPTGTLQPSATTQASAQLSSGGVWATSQHNSGPDQGTFSLQVASSGTHVAVDSNVTLYAGAQGTLTTKLEPQQGTGAAGEVVATVTFTSASTWPGLQPDAGNPDAGGPDAGPSCIATLTGDLSGTVPCSASGYLQGSTGTTGLSFIGSVHAFPLADGGTAPMNLIGVVNLHGDLQAQTYTSANTVNANGAIQLFLTNSGAGWQSTWDGNPAHTVGTFSATVTDTGPVQTYNGDKIWASVHGTYSTALVPNNPDAGSGVNVSVTY